MALARDVVDEERMRLAVAEADAARSPEDLAADVLARLAAFEGGAGPDSRAQRDGRDRAHEPRAGAVAGGRDPGCRRCRRGDAVPRARSRDGSQRPPIPRGRGASRRAHRRRGRAGRDEQRGGARALGRAGGPRRRRGEPGRARGDRRRRPHPGDRPSGRREARRGRDDEPDPRRRLRGGARRRHGPARPPRPPVELPAGGVHRGARSRGTGRRRRTRTARSSSTTWAPGRCSTRPRSAWPTSRRRPNGSPPAPTS